MPRSSIFISAVNNIFSNSNGGGDNSKANQIIAGNGENFFLWWQPTEESMRNLGHLMAITSIILLVVTILGVYLMITSLIGNSGEQRSKGAGMAWTMTPHSSTTCREPNGRPASARSRDAVSNML